MVIMSWSVIILMALWNVRHSFYPDGKGERCMLCKWEDGMQERIGKRQTEREGKISNNICVFAFFLFP